MQSPAYSDISDANDQSPILDAELTDIKKDQKMADAPSVAPGSHPALGGYGMYPFYAQPPFLGPAGAAGAAGGPTEPPKAKEERRESEGKAAGGAEGAKNAVGDPFKALPGANAHMAYPPFGFIPPYPAYAMDPLVVDPGNGLRGSTKTPEANVHSPRLRIDMSPSRSGPKLSDDPAKDQLKVGVKDTKAPLDQYGVNKSSLVRIFILFSFYSGKKSGSDSQVQKLRPFLIQFLYY